MDTDVPLGTKVMASPLRYKESLNGRSQKLLVMRASAQLINFVQWLAGQPGWSQREFLVRSRIKCGTRFWVFSGKLSRRAGISQCSILS